MKKLIVTLVAGAALLVPTASAMAAGGQGGLAGKVATMQEKVATYQQKCGGTSAPKRCADKKAALAGKLGALEAKIDARLAESGTKAKKAAALQSARDTVASLIAGL